MPLGKLHEPIHLYHESKPALVTYSEADERAICFDQEGKPTGYSRTYVPQEYPKHVVVDRDKDGFPARSVEVKDAEEEAALSAPKKGKK